MTQAYWINSCRSVSNPAAPAEYAKLAEPAIETGGGRFLARGMTVKTYEQGLHRSAGANYGQTTYAPLCRQILCQTKRIKPLKTFSRRTVEIRFMASGRRRSRSFSFCSMRATRCGMSVGLSRN